MSARHASALDALLIDDSFEGDVYPNESLARHTMYRIGGPARYYVQVASLGSLTKLIEACRASQIPWVVLGRGSNVLVSDEGFDGVAITLGRDFRSFHYDDERKRFCAGAGVPLSTVVQDAFHRCLSGLEFAVGTPGTIGGAVRMNAGTREDWMGSRVMSVTTVSPENGLRLYDGSEVNWGYRSTSFAPDEVIVECELSVEPADPFYLRAKMEASHSRRKKTQPLSQPSCGSVFRNPEGYSSAWLIEQVGLKGKRVGGAQISPMHANFIVNTGGACARDVLALIEEARQKVYEEHGIELQPEVRFLGFA